MLTVLRFVAFVVAGLTVATAGVVAAFGAACSNAIRMGDPFDIEEDDDGGLLNASGCVCLSCQCPETVVGPEGQRLC